MHEAPLGWGRLFLGMHAAVNLEGIPFSSVPFGSELGPREGISSQMPRHLISDAHEWINEIPTVPIYCLAKPQPRERAWEN
jgi:hypothetical protein